MGKQIMNEIEDKTMDNNLKVVFEKITIALTSTTNEIVDNLKDKPVLDGSIDDIIGAMNTEIDNCFDDFFDKLKEGMLTYVTVRSLRALVCIKVGNDKGLKM